MILISLPIAGCTLAASVAAGLTDRKRPFSLLRLTGAPLALLRRVVALESAVPLLAVAAVSIGAGFGASAMFTTVQLQHARSAGHRLLSLHRGRDRGLSWHRRRHVPAAEADHRPRSGQKRMTPSDRLAHRLSCWAIR